MLTQNTKDGFIVHPISFIIDNLSVQVKGLDREIDRLASSAPELTDRLRYLNGALRDVLDYLDNYIGNRIKPV